MIQMTGKENFMQIIPNNATAYLSEKQFVREKVSKDLLESVYCTLH